jgi:hypothetical protein
MSTGEILVAYSLRIKPHGADIQAWSTRTTNWKLISPGYELGRLRGEELEKVLSLKEWWGINGGAPGAKGEIIKRDSNGNVVNEDGPIKSRKLAQIKDVQPGKYYDLIVEVISHEESLRSGCESVSCQTVCSLCYGLYSEYVFV